jgi:hypothetical protein
MKKALIIIAIIAAVVVIAYFIFFKKTDTSTDSGTTTNYSNGKPWTSAGTGTNSGTGSSSTKSTGSGTQSSTAPANPTTFDITTGQLPTTYDQAQAVLLSPSSTDAQQAAAQTILAGMDAYNSYGSYII